MRKTKLWFEAYAKAERVMDGISRLAAQAKSQARWVDQFGAIQDDIEEALTAGFLEQLKAEAKKDAKRPKRLARNET